MRSRTHFSGAGPLLVLAVAITFSLTPVLCTVWVTYRLQATSESYVASKTSHMELVNFGLCRILSTNLTAEPIPIEESVQWHPMYDRELFSEQEDLQCHSGTLFVEERSIYSHLRQNGIEIAGIPNLSNDKRNQGNVATWDPVVGNIDSSPLLAETRSTNSTQDVCQIRKRRSERQNILILLKFQEFITSTTSFINGLRGRIWRHPLLILGNRQRSSTTQPSHNTSSSPTAPRLHLKPNHQSPSSQLPITTSHSLGFSITKSTNSSSLLIPKYSSILQLKDSGVTSKTVGSHGSFLAIVISIIVAVFWF